MSEGTAGVESPPHQREDIIDARRTADTESGHLPAAARDIAKRELVEYVLRTPASERAMARAERVLPLGVASSFQFYEPHPLVLRRAAGSHVEDLDGQEYVDFTLGYGALFTGHSHPVLQRAVAAQLSQGTLFASMPPMDRIARQSSGPSISRSRNGSGVSTGACCCRQGSTNNGCFPSPTARRI